MLTLMLSDPQAEALEQALSARLKEMELELARTEDRRMQHELHQDWNRINEVFEQLSRRRRFISSVLGHPGTPPSGA